MFYYPPHYQIIIKILNKPHDLWYHSYGARPFTHPNLVLGASGFVEISLREAPLIIICSQRC